MSEPIIEYRDEFNVMDLASKYAERVSRVIDEQTLANVEHQLAEYGYVKAVRCRDCRYHEYMRVSYLNEPLSVCISEQWIGAEGDNPLVKLNGFCAWGERKKERKD